MAKRTLKNCSVIKEGISLGIGTPKQYDSLCEGYANKDGDEPCEICRMCKLNTTYEIN